jgi:prolipoprotein diacylglyceryltransferase
MIDRKASDRVGVCNTAAFAALTAILAFCYLADRGPVYQIRRPREAMALCLFAGIVIGGRVTRFLCGGVTRDQFEEMRGCQDDRLVKPASERGEDG